MKKFGRKLPQDLQLVFLDDAVFIIRQIVYDPGVKCQDRGIGTNVAL